MNQIMTFECLTEFRKPLIEKIINSIKINPNSRGLDVGCGIGQITNLLSNYIGQNGNITGLDYSSDLIEYAKHHFKKENTEFLQGDINNLQLPLNTYDWIWIMDTLWVGPEEFGCPAKEPDKILNKLYQMLKPGGKIYLLYWTAQRLLPGYPLLEASLNASASSNAPYIETMKPYTHIMNGKKWLRNAKFSEIQINTFVGDIVGPLNENDRRALSILFQMLWKNSQKEVSKKDKQIFAEICVSDSNKFILNDPDYYGFYTYTLFQGKKID